MTGDLVSAALVGTARAAVPLDALDPAVAAAARRVRGEPAAQLLAAAALDFAHRRAGVLPVSGRATSTAPPDDRPPLPPAAAGRLPSLLAQPDLLPEWFAAVRARGYRAPDHQVPMLLAVAPTLPGHRAGLLDLAGAQGRWLAGLNPDWAWALPADHGGEDVWHHGDLKQRAAWLGGLRATDPARALGLLAATWKAEHAATRATLLRALAAGLSGADEGFLEGALDDRSKDVREVAADLLGRLPGSAFAARMGQRATTWVCRGRAGLVVAVPQQVDAAAARDGLLPQRAATERAWLGAAVQAAPLPLWQGVLGPPGQALDLASGHPLREVLLGAWAQAATRQQDAAWALALFRHRPAQADAALLALVPAGQVAGVVTAGGVDAELNSGAADALLDRLGHPWPGDVARHVLGLLLARATRPPGPGRGYDVPHLATALKNAAAAHFPPEMLPLVHQAQQRTADTLWTWLFRDIATTLHTRHAMLEELS